MAEQLSYPDINGVRHGFSSIQIKVATAEGVKIPVFCKAINYGRKRTRALIRGNHPDPVAKTRGENEYNGSLEIYEAEWDMLREALGDGYGDKLFTVYVQKGEDGFDTKTDELQGCTIDETDGGGSQGPDGLLRKIDLAPLKVMYDDTDDLETPLAPPQ